MPSTTTRAGDETPWRAELRDALRRLRRPTPSASEPERTTARERRRPVIVLVDGGADGPTAAEVARQLGAGCRVVRVGPTGAAAADGPLRWITALHGCELRLIAVEDVCCFRSDHKYTAVLTAEGESLIRLSLRELAARLDPALFWQVHRGTLVNARAIHSVRRDDRGQLALRLKARPEVLKVSESCAYRFKHL